MPRQANPLTPAHKTTRRLVRGIMSGTSPVGNAREGRTAAPASRLASGATASGNLSRSSSTGQEDQGYRVGSPPRLEAAHLAGRRGRSGDRSLAGENGTAGHVR